jgi:hypothetical protein
MAVERGYLPPDRRLAFVMARSQSGRSSVCGHNASDGPSKHHFQKGIELINGQVSDIFTNRFGQGLPAGRRGIIEQKSQRLWHLKVSKSGVGRGDVDR